MDVDNATSASTVQFKCAKCRRLLFMNEHVYEHHRGNTNEICGFGLFIAPMKWMTLDRYQDKVSLNLIQSNPDNCNASGTQKKLQLSGLTTVAKGTLGHKKVLQ